MSLMNTLVIARLGEAGARALFRAELQRRLQAEGYWDAEEGAPAEVPPSMSQSLARGLAEERLIYSRPADRLGGLCGYPQ